MKYLIIPFFLTTILTGCVVNPYPYNESYQRTEFYAPENSTLIYHETNVYPQNNYNYYGRDYRHNNSNHKYNKRPHNQIPYKSINNQHYVPNNRFNYNRPNHGSVIIKIK